MRFENKIINTKIKKPFLIVLFVVRTYNTYSYNL